MTGASEDPRLPSLRGSELTAALAALDAGTAWREALERLLVELPESRAALLMQRLREGRGAWLPLTGARGGRALLVGDALSGTAVVLARTGFRLAVVDGDRGRLRFARARDAALTDGSATFIEADARGTLPFASGAFDLVVDERGGASDGELRELIRVARGEVFALADNRFAYKRSSGRRADFHIPGPLRFARDALRPRLGERSGAQWRRAAADAGAPHVESLALYPHRHDFSHAVDLGGRGPELTVGPMERRNRLKLAAREAGLFGALAPSLALRASGRPLPERRVDRLLAAVAERIGTPTPTPQHLIATRGSTAVILTDHDDPRARWALHLALSPAQERQARRHFRALGRLAEQFPHFPAPAPLAELELDGQYASVEERLGGLSAPQLTGDLKVAERVYEQLADDLARLVCEPAAAIDGQSFAALFEAKVRLVQARAARESTVRALDRLLDEAREQAHGVAIPLVLYHADLRAKHVQVDPDGRVLGLMDWGSHEVGDLPYFDLLNLVIHDRKQAAGSTVAWAWRLVRAGGLRDFERAALDRHAERLGLAAGYVRAIETLYPALVGAMAEKNWDYSRPRWIHRSFEL